MESINYSIRITKTASGKGLWVFGQTMQYKENLKGIGGSWNSSKKTWVFSLKHKQHLLNLFNLKETDISCEEETTLKSETISMKQTIPFKQTIQIK